MKNRVHGLRFEFLETRTLLSASHHVAAHHDSTGATVPLVLDGTLTVDNTSPTTTMNEDGSTTQSVPVAGRLGALGAVRGVWNETVDQYGDYVGPDVLRLHTASGTFFVAFDNASPGTAQRAGKGTIYYEHLQRVYDPTGVYAGDSETGTIDLDMNRAQTHVISLRLQTQRS
jgi:hypothetical protein